ncbi:alpha/beta hydrolase [Bacillus sp. A116_S68]|nr:alpha/beta hydrolase [Bacillus sp. A116_S68]
MVLHYKEYGQQQSPLIVFLHGGGMSGWMWDEQVTYFSPNFHCLVPDIPGQGRSINESPFTIAGAAEQINDLIEQKRQHDTVAVVGFSLGAQVLVAMLGQRPHSIDFAMINSALVKSIPFAKTLTKTMGLAYPLMKSRSFSKIQAKSMYIKKDYWNTYYDESCRIKKEAFTQLMNENMSFSLPSNFDKVSSNLLVTVGAKEKRIMRDSMKNIVNSNANCRGVIIPKIGHGCSLANPHLFNQLLEQWIEHDRVISEMIEYR